MSSVAVRHGAHRLSTLRQIMLKNSRHLMLNFTVVQRAPYGAPRVAGAIQQLWRVRRCDWTDGDQRGRSAPGLAQRLQRGSGRVLRDLSGSTKVEHGLFSRSPEWRRVRPWQLAPSDVL